MAHACRAFVVAAPHARACVLIRATSCFASRVLLLDHAAASRSGPLRVLQLSEHTAAVASLSLRASQRRARASLGPPRGGRGVQTIADQGPPSARRPRRQPGERASASPPGGWQLLTPRRRGPSGRRTSVPGMHILCALQPRRGHEGERSKPCISQSHQRSMTFPCFDGFWRQQKRRVR